MSGATKTVVIGLGNPILSDDGVGLRVARRVASSVRGMGEVDTVELGAGGVRLVEAMAGYGRAFLVDAMVTGEPPGTVREFSPAAFVTTRHGGCGHDTTLAVALETGRLLGIPLPPEIAIWGIEGARLDEFGEELTPAVAAAVPLVAARIVARIQGGSGA